MAEFTSPGAMQGKWQLVAWWHHFPSPSGWKTSGSFTTEPWSTHSHWFETGAISQCSNTYVVQHILYLASMSWLHDHTFHHLPQNMLSRCWVFPLSCATRCVVRSAGSWAQETAKVSLSFSGTWVISLRFPIMYGTYTPDLFLDMIDSDVGIK